VKFRNLTAAWAFALLLVVTPAARAETSQRLAEVLAQVRNLSSKDFFTLACWARGGAPKPATSASEPQEVEADILHLARHDEDALFAWLGGDGRAALYGAGANDADIGDLRSEVDAPVATPTPNLWRDVPLASATLTSSTQVNVQIVGGFAAIKQDGTAAVACVSFKNVGSVPAKRIVFEFPLLNVNGQEIAKLALERTGVFPPNVEMQSFASMATWQSGDSPGRSFPDNCTKLELPTAAIPLLQARVAGYRVMRVEYTDGSIMLPPG
jgi:hypothetical protein